MSDKPRFDLNEIQKQIDDCCFCYPNKSSRAVVTVFRVSKQLTEPMAEKFIREEIKKLNPEDFFEQAIAYPPNDKGDAYGKIIEGVPWYIKVYLDTTDGSILLSFHPAEYDMKLQNGTIISKGGWVYDKKNEMWKVR